MMLCECGCGLPAPIATRTRPYKGYVKGQTLRWRRGHASARPRPDLEVPFAERFARYVFCHGDPDACWIWTGATNSHGYGQTAINGKMVGAHVVTYRYFKGELPDGKPVVRHTCDQPACCNPTHLIAGTQADNNADMVARDRQVRGELHGMAKLTPDIVRTIRAGRTGTRGEAARLGRQYGVARTTINDILHGRTWKHV